MVIFKIITGSFEIHLMAENSAYWIRLFHTKDFRIYRHSTLFYSKKYTFALFAKMASWLLTKKYISYNSGL